MRRRTRRRSVSSVNAVEEALARIERLDPELRAFARVRREEALAEAAAVDPSLPLAGVPVAVKDNLAVAGVPRRLGSRATSAEPVAEDDELVRRVRAAGAVVVGTTRMPELAIWPFTEFEHDEPVRNPRAPELTSGGSSGGAAVAVATGMARLAVGSDGGGSLRVPAACCGVVGFKPGAGVVPSAPHWGGLTEFGPLAATVADAALLLDVLAGSDRFRRVTASPLRVAVSTRPAMPGAKVHPEARAAVEAVGAALASAGHEVVAADPPYPKDLGPRFMRRWLPGIAADARGLDPALLETRTRKMARAGRLLGPLGADSRDAVLTARMERWFGDVDVLLTPTLADPLVPAGRWAGSGWIRTALGVGNWLLTTPWNLVGFPAASTPGGTTSRGTPIGVQLVAAPGGEERILAAALAIEQATP